jgi:hypothetical protein
VRGLLLIFHISPAIVDKPEPHGYRAAILWKGTGAAQHGHNASNRVSLFNV